MTDRPTRRQSDPRIDELVIGLKVNEDNIERILLVIEGTAEVNAHGEVVGYIGGMRNDISDMKHQGNGGGGFSLRAKDKAQITALIGFIVVIIEGIVRV